MKKFNNRLHLLLPVLCIVSTFSIAHSQTLYWQRITPDNRVYSLLYDDEQYLYCTGEKDNIYHISRSSDRGASWTQLVSGSPKIHFLAIDGYGVLWGASVSPQGIFKSTDQGSTWIQCLSSGDRIYSLTVSDNNWIWGGTEHGKVLYSSDTGNSWEEDSLSSGVFWSIASNEMNHIFAGTNSSRIFRTTDSGESWQMVYSAPLGSIQGIVCDQENIIFAHNYSKMLISNDNGNTWTVTDAPGIYNLFMDNYHNFYAEPGWRSLNNCINWSVISSYYTSAVFAFIDSLVFMGTNNGLFMYDPSYVPYMGVNFFPLAKGNIWQYNTRCNNEFHGNKIYFVSKDTVISEKTYHRLSGSVNDWVRYDLEQNKLLLRWNDSDYLVMDFTLNEGSTFQRIVFNSHQLTGTTVIAPSYLSVFDSLRYTKGDWYRYGSGSTTGSIKTYYSENFGESKETADFTSPGGGSSSCQKKVIRAILNDSTGIKYFSDHQKPSIWFVQDDTIVNFNINWNFSVTHAYSFFGNGFNENFVDSVIMFSYYSNDDSVLSNAPFSAVQVPGSVMYRIQYPLDSTWMKNGSTFYYKLYAVDKGVVPEYSVLPDSGYYSLVYEPAPVSVKQTDQIIKNYSLEQNFPNSFNPSTTIRYSLPVFSRIRIEVFDILGNEIETLVDEEKPAGRYETTWNAADQPSGVYFYRLQAGDFVETKKMILMR